MPNPVYRTATFLAQLVHRLPIGTNLAMAHLLFALLAGHLLSSRGALFPALAATGLHAAQVRAAEAALRQGKWDLAQLLTRLAGLIRGEGRAQSHRIEGWQPLPIDWVGFFRLRLLGCLTKHYSSQAQKALPAIEIGMVATVKHVGARRIPCLLATTRSGDTAELLAAAKQKQGHQDVLVADRQVKISHLHQAGIKQFVVRAAINLTARRSQPRPAEPGKRGRKPTRGAMVRPLPRTFKGKMLPGTEPDGIETFRQEGRSLTALRFDALVVPGCPLVFSCLVVYDPKYKQPWVLLTDLAAAPAKTIYLLYHARWQIERLPQTGKQLLGGHRAFVHAEAARYRLPELCLLAASLSLYLAATSAAVATGFWDRHPQPTPGRFRRALSGAPVPPFEEFAALCPRVRKKASVHAHLVKGVAAHRRQSRRATAPLLTEK